MSANFTHGERYWVTYPDGSRILMEAFIYDGAVDLINEDIDVTFFNAERHNPLKVELYEKETS